MDIILKYICMPIAISTLKHNEKLYDYDKFKIVPPYLNLHESLVKAIEKDFYELKREVIQDHNLNIRKQSAGRYMVNGKVVEFTSEELREGTKKVIQSYMYGENMVKLENEEYPWSDTTYNPPDVDGEDNR